MSVLGYMLVLHQSHNLFGDPMVMPLFSGVTIFLKAFGKVTMKVGDRFKIWVVDGEDEIEEEYDEGPSSRNKGALPPGMAAIDQSIAECIEDAYTVGYTDDSLAKLLGEAISFVPPGSSIQVAQQGAAAAGGAALADGQCAVSEAQMQQLMQMQAQGLLPTPQAVPGGVGTVPMAVPGMMMPPGMMPPGMMPPGMMPGFPGMGMPGMPMPGMPMPPGMAPGMPMGPVPGMGVAPGFGAKPLPEGVPPPPGAMGAAAAGEGDVAFTDFMSAFRTEMKQARDQGERMAKFVPSSKVHAAKRQADLDRRANEIFGVGVAADFAIRDEADASLALAEEFDEWPDEFLLLGVAEQDAAQGGSSPDTSRSDTSTTTSETASTDETEEETEDDGEDAWPIEMLVG
jgi:hypothetical protein